MKTAGKTILWLEDDGENHFHYEIEVLKEELGMSMSVIMVPTAGDAIDILANTTVHAILSDLHLRSDHPLEGIDERASVEFIRNLKTGSLNEALGKKELEKLPVLIVSGFYDQSALAIVKPWPEILLYCKPIAVDELVLWIKKQIS
jgi:hypothetical protein